MRKLKILFTASRASHIINFHSAYIQKLRRQGHIIEAVSEGTIPEGLVDKSYDFTFRKKIYSPRNFYTIQKISKLIDESNYDIIISNTTLASIITRLAIPISKKKRPYHIYICHGYLFKDDNSKKSQLYRTIEKCTSSKVDLLLTMNHEDYALAKKYGLCRNIHHINGMGLNSEKFPHLDSESINEFRAGIGANKDDFIFLCVGEFSERKNQRLIINAFSELLKSVPNALLIFAGTGELLDEAKKLAEYKEISHRIRFLGQVFDTNILYRSSQAVVSASRSEGLPFNIMESLECAKPVIASNVKGHSDLITDGINGFLFRDNDSESLLEKMTLITDNRVYASFDGNIFLDDKYKSESASESLLKYCLYENQVISAGNA